MKNGDIYLRRYKIQELLYIGQWRLGPLQSRHLGTSHSSPSHLQLPHCIFLNLIDDLKSLPFKGDFSFGKSQKSQGPNLGCRAAESPEWFDVSPKNSARDMMHERACCHDEAANHQLPTAVAFWIIRIVSTEECSSFTQNLMQIHCSTQSFWMWRPHSTHAHSKVSTTPTD